MTKRFADPRDTYQYETKAAALRELAEAIVASTAVVVAESRDLLVQSEALAWDHADLKAEWTAERTTRQVTGWATPGSSRRLRDGG